MSVHNASLQAFATGLGWQDYKDIPKVSPALSSCSMMVWRMQGGTAGATATARHRDQIGCTWDLETARI